LRLPINEKAPDTSCLSRFRDEVIKVKGLSFFDSLFNNVLTQAQERGVVFGTIHAIDSTHTVANVNTFNDRKNQDTEGKPRDPDASWGTKKTEIRKTVEGKKVKVPVHFYGYKTHLDGETDFGLIHGFHTTDGATADIDGWDVLIHRVLSEKQRKGIDVLLADKAGGCPVWINILEKYDGILTAFSLPENMLTKGEHKEKWQAYKADEGRKAFKKERYVIERINADLKNNHSLRRCRYLGKIKYHLQAAMAAIAHNIKIMVRLITGVKFRSI
jgi:IS5 family transposase